MTLDSLNEEQKMAVEYIESPLLVVAEPVTGKKRVLIEKIVYLVKNDYDPNILFLPLKSLIFS